MALIALYLEPRSVSSTNCNLFKGNYDDILFVFIAPVLGTVLDT